MSISEFFKSRLGVKLTNTRWSWGASSPGTRQVFLRVWDDDFETIDGVEHIRILGKDWVGSSRGLPERHQHIKELRKGSEGYGVLCTAEDTDPSKARSIKTFNQEVLLKFGKIIDVGRNVFAPIVDRIPAEKFDNPIVHDLNEIREKYPDKTTQNTYVDARLGQGQFRAHVLQRWDFRCCVTGSTTQAAIIASHIKPWKDSNDRERLDRHNGLPLIATVDKLFDKGLVTFSSDGDLLVSQQLDASEKALLGLDGRRKLLQSPGRRTAEYLAYHRTSIFLDEQVQKTRRKRGKR